ncbi:MAG: NlpC/P60 family protein [Smithellaceae bacterium]|jgi:LysM repeat protein
MREWQFFVFSLFLSLCFINSSLAKEYTVKTGDNLKSISKESGISVNEIKEANNLTKTILQPNQVLIIPEKSTAVYTAGPKPKAKRAVYYTVKNGDTLSAITRKTGVPVKQIMALNTIHPKSLRIGRKLVLAKSTQLSENESIDEDGEDVEDDENGGKKGDLAQLEKEQQKQEELLGKWRNPDERQLFVKVATGFLGAPYRLGGSSLKGIDCSAFVRKIYQIFDIDLPRDARAQSKVGMSIDREELVEGDLVFFRTRRPLGHVGIYIGNNEFVHASSMRKVVRIDSMDTPYFQKRFQRAVRIKGLDNKGV